MMFVTMVQKGKISLELMTSWKDERLTYANKTYDEDSQEMFNIIQDKKIDKNIKEFLINYFFVRTVNYIENYYRNMVRVTIDNFKIDPKGILPNDEITLSILEFEKIKKEYRSKKGWIISHNFNFQNIDEINSVLSKLFQTDFFMNLSKELNKIKLHSKFSNDAFYFNWKSFREIFKTRHEIVHRTRNSTFTLFQLDECRLFALYFVMIGNYVTATLILKKYKEKKLTRNKRYEYLVQYTKTFHKAHPTLLIS